MKGWKEIMSDYRMPENFLWGGALSACQAEGAYNVDGKTLTIPEVMQFNAKNDRKVTKQLKITREMIEEAKNDPDTVKYPKRRGIDFYHTYKEDMALFKEMGFKVVTIIDPGVKVDKGYKIYDEGLKEGYFATDKDGIVYKNWVWPGNSVFPDFMNSKTREWWAGNQKIMMDLGVSGIWNDMNEPAIFYTPRAMAQAMHKVEESKDKNIDLGTFFGIKDSFSQIMNKEEYFKEMHHDMDGKCVRHYDVHNLYGYNMTRAAGEAFEKLRPSERVLLFSRASYVGMHRYGGIWTGDNRSWWSHLLLNIKMMPSLNMCGFLYSGADVGGFSDNTTEDLLTRWIQFGIFMPLLRNHTAAWTRQQEPYAFEHTERLKKWIKLRYALIPHLYSEYMKAALEGGMYFKPLAFEYEIGWPNKIVGTNVDLFVAIALEAFQ